MVDQHLVNDGVMGIGFAWHPNGKLFMADWIGGYPLDGIGAVWSIDTRANDQHPLRAETQRLLAAGFAQTAKDALVQLLGHADQRVRQGAQLELAKRGQVDAFLKVALDGQAALLRAHPCTLGLRSTAPAQRCHRRTRAAAPQPGQRRNPPANG
jgi:hypothetical protein